MCAHTSGTRPLNAVWDEAGKYVLTYTATLAARYSIYLLYWYKRSVYVSSYYECISALLGYHELRVKYEDT
jgi:hypothetical protein